MNKQKVGTVNHYYNEIGVALVKLNEGLKIGDRVHFLGHSTDFDQKVQDIEIDHKKVEEGNTGETLAIKVEEKVREGDEVIKEVD